MSHHHRYHPRIDAKRRSLTIKVLFMMLIAIVVALAYFDPPPAGQFYFDIPAEKADWSIDAFMATYHGHGGYPVADIEGIRTHAVKGWFTPCDALHQLLEGTSIEVVAISSSKFPKPPKPACAFKTAKKRSAPREKGRRLRIDTIIDPPRCLRCLEISGIPIPWCEDDRGSWLNDHECAK